MQPVGRSFFGAELIGAWDTASSGGNVARVSPLVSVLVVDYAFANALPITSLFEASQFHVTFADAFPRANARLVERAPALLVTELRLGEYNGLQLVLNGKQRRPSMAAVVLSSIADPVLQADAESMGATFVLTPISARHLMAAAWRTLMRGSGGEPIRPPFERRHRERRLREVPTEEDRRRGERRRDIVTLAAGIAGFGPDTKS